MGHQIVSDSMLALYKQYIKVATVLFVHLVILCVYVVSFRELPGWFPTSSPMFTHTHITTTYTLLHTYHTTATTTTTTVFGSPH